MANSTYALVLTGDVLPGFTPESVWPALAAYFRMEPAKLDSQLLKRAPLTIKHSDDLGKLQTLQGGAAAIGATTEICAPDERKDLFVVLDNAPRGPMPRVYVDERVAHGLWASGVMVAEVGANTWTAYREFDAEAVAATASPAPAPVADDMFEALANEQQAAPLELMPLADTYAGEGLNMPLPAGSAIHAGFWRRCAALIIDSILIGIVFVGMQLIIGLGAISGISSASVNVASIIGSLFLAGALALVGQWLYFAFFESSTAQATLGKMAMGIKTVDLAGHRIGFGRASGRYFGKIISSMIFDIGYMLAGWTERKQALHDMMAGTLVVFRDVQPGHPLPTVRPPMPWYGWLLNILLAALVPLAILAAIALPAYNGYAGRSKLAAAMIAADSAQIAVSTFYAANGRCPDTAAEAVADLHAPSYVGSMALLPNCAINVTFKGTNDVDAALRGARIELRGKPDSPGSLRWTCSSTLATSYLPKSCRP